MGYHAFMIAPWRSGITSLPHGQMKSGKSSLESQAYPINLYWQPSSTPFNGGWVGLITQLLIWGKERQYWNFSSARSIKQSLGHGSFIQGFSMAVQ